MTATPVLASTRVLARVDHRRIVGAGPAPVAASPVLTLDVAVLLRRSRPVSSGG